MLGKKVHAADGSMNWYNAYGKHLNIFTKL